MAGAVAGTEPPPPPLLSNPLGVAPRVSPIPDGAHAPTAAPGEPPRDTSLEPSAAEASESKAVGASSSSAPRPQGVSCAPDAAVQDTTTATPAAAATPAAMPADAATEKPAEPQLTNPFMAGLSGLWS